MRVVDVIVGVISNNRRFTKLTEPVSPAHLLELSNFL